MAGPSRGRWSRPRRNSPAESSGRRLPAGRLATPAAWTVDNEHLRLVLLIYWGGKPPRGEEGVPVAGDGDGTDTNSPGRPGPAAENIRPVARAGGLGEQAQLSRAGRSLIFSGSVDEK